MDTRALLEKWEAFRGWPVDLWSLQAANLVLSAIQVELRKRVAKNNVEFFRKRTPRKIYVSKVKIVWRCVQIFE